METDTTLYHIKSRRYSRSRSVRFSLKAAFQLSQFVRFVPEADINTFRPDRDWVLCDKTGLVVYCIKSEKVKSGRKSDNWGIRSETCLDKIEKYGVRLGSQAAVSLPTQLLY